MLSVIGMQSVVIETKHLFPIKIEDRFFLDQSFKSEYFAHFKINLKDDGRTTVLLVGKVKKDHECAFILRFLRL